MKKYRITTFYDGQVVTTGWLQTKWLADFAHKVTLWFCKYFPFTSRLDVKDASPRDT